MIVKNNKGKCIKEGCPNIIVAGTQAKLVGRDSLGREKYKCMTCWLKQKGKIKC